MKSAPLSKESQRRIISALELAGDLVCEGYEPSEALAKAASRWGVPHGHVRLMVHAYNAGRTEAQRKVSDKLEEKSASFDLADVDSVLRIMFPDDVRTEASIEKESKVSWEYSFSPQELLSKKAADLLYFEDKWNPKGKPPPLPPEPTCLMIRKASSLTRARHLCDEKRMQAQKEFDTACELMSKIATYFRRLDAEDVATVEKNAVILFGEKAAGVFKKLKERYPFLLRKKAASRTGPRVVDENKDPYKTIKEAVLAMDRFFLAEKEFVKASRILKKKEQEVLGLGKTAKENEQSSPDASKRDESDRADTSKKEPSWGESVLDWFGGSTETPDSSSEDQDSRKGGFLSRLYDSVYDYVFPKITSPSKSELDRQARERERLLLASHLSPRHLENLRRIKTQLVLQDLVENDEIISSYEPEEIESAYLDIATLVPNVAESKDFLRTLLRKRLQQGAFDIHDIKLISQTARHMTPILGERAMAQAALSAALETGRASHSAKDYSLLNHLLAEMDTLDETS